MLALVAVGAVGTLFWVLGFNPAFYSLFVAVGSPSPSVWLWLMLCGLSLLFGLIPGALIPLVAPRHLLLAWSIFFVTLASVLAVMALMYAESVTVVANNLKSPGAWSFVAGTLIAMATVSRMQRRGT